MAAEYKERVGSRIRQAREARDWSQNELARELPGTVGGDQVGRWERGEVMPRTTTLEAIADALELDVSYFLAPEPQEGTPDLMGRLNGNGDDVVARLVRVEAKLDELLALVRTRPADPLGLAEAVRDLPGADTPQDAPRAPASSPPRRRRAS